MDLYFIQLHEINQSPHNYEVNQGKIEWIGLGNTYLIGTGTQTVTKKLKTSTLKCHEDNSNMQKNCIDDFYSEKLGCILPWAKQNTQSDGVKFDQYKFGS